MPGALLRAPRYEEVKLRDFRTHHRVSVDEFKLLGAAAVVGTWPYALMCLGLHLSHLPWDASRGVLAFLGTCLIVRSYAGSDWIVRLVFWYNWIFSDHLDGENREAIGPKRKR